MIQDNSAISLFRGTSKSPAWSLYYFNVILSCTVQSYSEANTHLLSTKKSDHYYI